MSQPTIIGVRYKSVDGWHVFSSDDLPGLYVASRDAEKAFNDVAPSIEKLILLNEGIKVRAELEQSFSDFLKSRSRPRQIAAKRRIARFKEQQKETLVMSDKRYIVYAD